MCGIYRVGREFQFGSCREGRREDAADTTRLCIQGRESLSVIRIGMKSRRRRRDHTHTGSGFMSRCHVALEFYWSRKCNSTSLSLLQQRRN